MYHIAADLWYSACNNSPRGNCLSGVRLLNISKTVGGRELARTPLLPSLTALEMQMATLKTQISQESKPGYYAVACTTITAETFRALLDYEPDTGIFRWRVSRRRIQMGAVAGSPNKDGYIRIMVNGMEFAAHRLAWLYVYGVMPQDQIDHLNGDKADNRIANLRDVPHCMNQQNQTRPPKNSTSGFRGVAWHKRDKRWQARIKVNGREQYIGYFETAEAAHAAYLAAKLQLHPGDIRHLGNCEQRRVTSKY